MSIGIRNFFKSVNLPRPSVKPSALPLKSALKKPPSPLSHDGIGRGSIFASGPEPKRVSPERLRELRDDGFKVIPEPYGGNPIAKRGTRFNEKVQVGRIPQFSDERVAKLDDAKISGIRRLEGQAPSKQLTPEQVEARIVAQGRSPNSPDRARNNAKSEADLLQRAFDPQAKEHATAASQIDNDNYTFLRR